MFPFSTTLEARRAELYQLVDEGRAGIAIVTAAGDFERTLRRAIIMLAKEPTAEVKSKIEEQYRTIGLYNKAWNKFVYPIVVLRLPDAVPEFAAVKKSFDARNNLIHGRNGIVSKAYALKHIAIIEGGTARVTCFAAEHGVDLMSRLKPRPRPRVRD